MVESSEDASLHTRLLQSNQPQVDEINTSPVVFSFPDGTQYTLPPGLQLYGLEPEDAIRLAALVRQYDSVFFQRVNIYWSLRSHTTRDQGE